jgi:hypothetical protein
MCSFFTEYYSVALIFERTTVGIKRVCATDHTYAPPTHGSRAIAYRQKTAIRKMGGLPDTRKSKAIETGRVDAEVRI